MIQHFSQSKKDYIKKIANKLKLTKSEAIVFKELLTCKKQCEIAKRLFISLKTVKFHTGSILKKAKAKKSMELFWELGLSWPREVMEQEVIEQMAIEQKKLEKNLPKGRFK